MTSRWKAAMAMVGLAWLVGCGGGDGDAPPPTPPAATVATVQVAALALDGSSLAGVSVTANGSAPVLTDAAGRAELTVANDVDLILAFSKSGLASQVKVLHVPAGVSRSEFRATLVPRQAALTVSDIALGGTVRGKDGTRATFPAGSLVDASGAVVSGAIQMQLTPINVLADTSAFPGRFAGTQGGAAPVGIVSYGTAEFHPTQNGGKLQIAPGKSVTIEIPMYADRHTDGSAVRLGQSIPLWSLNEGTGLWTQEGTGTVVANADSPTGLALRAEVSHFSWWNCDDLSGPEASVDVRCLGVDAGGNATVPLAAGQSCLIRAQVPDPRRRPATAATIGVDNDGAVGLRVPADTLVELYGESVANGVPVRGLVTVNIPAGERRTVVIPLVPPVAVTLLEPARDATLPSLGSATVTVGESVDRVEIYLGGVKVAEDTSAPYQLAFDTTAVSEGFTTLQARAFRSGSLVGATEPIPVIVDRSPPVVTLTRLDATAGDGRVRLLAQVSDLSPVGRVEFFRGSTLLGEATAFPFELTYSLLASDTPSVSFTARARDVVGNAGSSNVISFGTLAPTVALTRNPSTATLTSSQAVTFSATAASSNGIDRVEFFKGSIRLGEDRSPPYEIVYTVTGADEPVLNVMAKAIDADGNSASASLAVPVNISSGDAVAPVVALDAIASPVSTSSLELAAAASDDVGVAKVEFYVNGLLMGERTALSAGRYRLIADVGTLDGPVTFIARAYDAAGNTADSTRTATVRIVATLLAANGELMHAPASLAACPPSLGLSADGTPYVAHVVLTGNVPDAGVSRRIGGVWQSLGFANDPTSTHLQRFTCPTLGVTAAGEPFVAMMAAAGRSGDSGLTQIVRRFNGSAWVTEREIVATSGNDRISLVMDGANRPVIVWSGAVSGVGKRLNAERFEGGIWQTLATRFGSLGGDVGDFRLAVRPDLTVALVTVSSTGPFGNAIHALTIGDGGILSLGDSVTRKIDEVGDSSRSLRVLDITANAGETVVSYALLGSSISQTRTVRFDTASNVWRLLGTDADLVVPSGPSALAFQGGTLVQVLSMDVFAPALARRWNGSAWSAFTTLTGVNSIEARAVVHQDTLFLGFTQGGSAGVARLNVP